MISQQNYFQDSSDPACPIFKYELTSDTAGTPLQNSNIVLNFKSESAWTVYVNSETQNVTEQKDGFTRTFYISAVTTGNVRTYQEILVKFSRASVVNYLPMFEDDPVDVNVEVDQLW